MPCSNSKYVQSIKTKNVNFHIIILLRCKNNKLSENKPSHWFSTTCDSTFKFLINHISGYWSLHYHFLFFIVQLMLLQLHFLNYYFLNYCSFYSALTRNFGKMMFLKQLGKSVRLKAYPCIVRCMKLRCGSGGTVSPPVGSRQSPGRGQGAQPSENSRGFCLKKISIDTTFRTFSKCSFKLDISS